MGTKFAFLSTIFAILLMNGCSNKTDIETAEAEKVVQENAEKAEAERLAAEKAEAERLAAEKAEIERLAAQKIADVESVETFIVNVQNTPIETGSSELSDEVKENLHPVVMFLNKYPEASAVINNYTDSTGSEEINARLSTERAENIKAFLISQGVSEEQVIAIGHGATNYINNDDITSLENRRTEIELNSN